MKVDFDPSAFEDRYERAVVEMLRRKQAGLPAKSAAPVPYTSNVINLTDALKQSVKTERKRSARR
jgi:DNA end-binding protein Ku